VWISLLFIFYKSIYINKNPCGRNELTMQNDLNELLNEAKELLKGEMTKVSYDTWIKDLTILGKEQNTYILGVTSDFQKEAIMTRNYALIANTFKYITNTECDIAVREVSANTNGMQQKNNGLDSVSSISGYSSSFLNPKYTFDTFVVGNNNRFAHAAALAVAEAPASSYNPLFIYGGVGLGKTHLMHAIGNEILKHDHSSKILYVTSEKFTNQLINAIRDNTTENFRNCYRNVDVLLIDDIQFIAGKERIQEEFFHTFNTLHESGKQIILSSDRPPKEMKLLEDRLKSRFEWGLIADISNPDYETRLAILRKKAQSDSIVIDDMILSNIATKIDTNIRELEGVLNKMIAKASLTHSPLTLEMAEKAINDIISQKEKVVSVESIQEVVAKYFNINAKDLKSSKRSNDLAYPRQIAMYLCRDIAQMQLAKIGECFGKRDHTTVMHACRKIEAEIKENGNTKLIVDSVKNLLLNSN